MSFSGNFRPAARRAQTGPFISANLGSGVSSRIRRPVVPALAFAYFMVAPAGVPTRQVDTRHGAHTPPTADFKRKTPLVPQTQKKKEIIPAPQAGALRVRRRPEAPRTTVRLCSSGRALSSRSPSASIIYRAHPRTRRATRPLSATATSASARATSSPTTRTPPPPGRIIRPSSAGAYTKDPSTRAFRRTTWKTAGCSSSTTAVIVPNS